MDRTFIGLTACALLMGAAGSARADITISSGPTRNMACAAGICAPTANSAMLNVGDLHNMLAVGNVEVTTTGAGVQANNIVASANLSWSSAAVLTLDAYQSLEVGSPVAVTGSGGLNLLTNDGGSGGGLSFEPTGNITFQNLASPLAINGAVYTLVDSIVTLAQTGGNGFVALAQSYDASRDGTYAISPVQTLNGTFEGLGNTISNFSISDNNPEAVGLISQINATGSVSDLGLPNANIVSTNLTNLGEGALAGESAGQIFGVWSSGAVASERNSAGGLIGAASGGSITSSWSTAAITANVNGGGGLVGEVVGTTVDNCYATGDIGSLTTTWVGGLLGSAEQSLVENSFATGHVKGKGNSYGGSFVGGLIGITLEQVKVENSYASGKASAGTYSDVGGLIGYISKGGRFLYAYSTGAVTGGNGSSVGAFAGNVSQYFTPVFQDAYWDTDTAGTTAAIGNMNDPDGIAGLTSAEFQSGLPDGFAPNIWAEYRRIIHGFPYLLGNVPPPR